MSLCFSKPDFSQQKVVSNGKQERAIEEEDE